MTNQPACHRISYRMCISQKSTMMIVDHHRAKLKEEESV